MTGAHHTSDLPPPFSGRPVRRRRLPRWLAVPVVAICVGACGTTASTRVAIQAPAVTSFAFVDARPADARASYDYKIGRDTTQVIGDDAITPPPPDILRAVLQRRVGEILAGRSVELRAFKVDVSLPGNSGVVYQPGALALVMAGMLESISSTKRVLVRLTVAVDGTEHDVRHYDEYQGRVTSANVGQTIVTGFEELADRLAKAR